MSFTLAININSQISPPIFEKIQNGPNEYLWAWGTLIHEKNLSSTPFKKEAKNGGGRTREGGGGEGGGAVNEKKSQECRRGCMQAVPGILSNFYNKDQKEGGGDFSIPFLSSPSSFYGFIIGPYGFLFLKEVGLYM